MKPKLFIEGDSLVGKTSILLNNLAPYRQYGCGVVSIRLNDSNGVTKAFRLENYKNVAHSIEIYNRQASNIFLSNIENKCNINLSVFEKCTEYFKDIKTKKFVVLDEIGGVELKSRIYRDFMYQILSQDIACIGTIKSIQNLNLMTDEIGNQSIKSCENHKLRKSITDKGGKIVRFKENQEYIQKQIELFIREVI